MRSLNLDRLETLQAIAETQSFSAAARRLNLSQPAVSTQMRELEARFGVPLLERLGKKALPTAAGRDLLAHAQRIAAETQAIMALARRRREGWLGRVRLGTSTIALNFHLPPVLRRLRSAHPYIELAVTSGTTVAVLAQLARNELDAGVVNLPIGDRALEVVPLCEEPLLAIFPPDADGCAVACDAAIARAAQPAVRAAARAGEPADPGLVRGGRPCAAARHGAGQSRLGGPHGRRRARRFDRAGARRRRRAGAVRRPGAAIDARAVAHARLCAAARQARRARAAAGARGAADAARRAARGRRRVAGAERRVGGTDAQSQPRSAQGAGNRCGAAQLHGGGATARAVAARRLHAGERARAAARPAPDRAGRQEGVRHRGRDWK